MAGAVMLAVAGAGRAADAPAPPAPSRPPVPIEAFAALPVVESPRMSPDGRNIAARVAVNGTQYFAILPIGTGKPQLVGLGEVDLNWWRWIDDQWLVIGIGQMTSVQGDDWYVRRVLAVGRDGKMRNLSPRTSGQNADDVLWISHEGRPRILLAYQTSIYPSDPGFWPQVDEIDVATGRGHRVQSSYPDVGDWYADGDGVVRMGIGHGNEGRSTRVLYRDAVGQGFRTIDRARTRAESVTRPSLFLRNGGAMTIADDENGYSTLYDLDLATLKRGAVRFASKGYDISGLLTDRTGFALAGVSVNENRPGVHWIDPDMVAFAAEAQALAPRETVQIVSQSADRRRGVLHIGGTDAPGFFAVYDRTDKLLTDIGEVNPAIGLRRLNPVRTIRYTARDGLEIAAVLTLPRGKTTGLPLIVLPHGGPFARDTEEWDWWTQYLASRGYAVVQPNYRGSSGYGTAFTGKGAGQWGLAMQDDLNDAVTALAAQGTVDPKRVCMVGASYGGYAAMRAAERDGRLYRCAVSYAGVSDLPAMMRYDSQFLMAGVRRDWMRTQAPDLRAVSPITDVAGFSIPLLLVHGAKDRTVPVGQSRSLFRKLTAAGKPASYIEQPLGDHHFSRAEDRLQFLKALDAFLAEHNPA